MNATVTLWLDGSPFHLHVFICFRPLGCDSSMQRMPYCGYCGLYLTLATPFELCLSREITLKNTVPVGAADFWCLSGKILVEIFCRGSCIGFNKLSPPKSEMEESIHDNNVERCDDKFRSSNQKMCWSSEFELLILETRIMMATHIARVWINQVRLPILLVVS